MPQTKSAKKALRQTKKRRVMNLKHLEKMRNLIRQYKKLILQKQKEEAKKLLPQLYKFIDKAAKCGVIKGNTASRKKARLTKNLNKLP